MLAYFLFFFYLVSGTILSHVIIRRKIFPFTIYHTSSIILFKVSLGCLYGWIFLHFYGGDDTWNFFNESKDATTLLLHHPSAFFRELYPLYSLQSTGYHFFDAIAFYISHFERWFMVRGLGLLNLLSAKNYYIDVLLFDFITLPGQLLLFKVMASVFPQRSGMNFLLIFFIPSVVFWCSGIRSEAIILLSVVLTIYNGYSYTKKPAPGNITGMLAGFAGLLLFRYQFLAIFLPFFITYLISLKKQKQGPAWFNITLLVTGAIFMASLFFPPRYQMSRPIKERQQKFFSLHGNTRYPLDTLESGPVSFIKVFPQATRNSLFRPFPWEGKGLLQSFSSVDVIFMVAGLLFFLVGPARKRQVSHPIYWLFLYYAIIQMVLIGYGVPFPGAIVRYRSIPFLMLILFLYAGNPLLQQKLRYWIFKLH
jgi:hypothetical protein